MSVPGGPSGDKLVRDYLARVTEAGLRYLPKGQRMAFVGQTKARIERECGAAGLSDPARVMEVLSGLGEPEDLVRRERARIDAAWVKRRAADPEAGEAAAAAVTVPLAPRPITSRWKPATNPRRPLPPEAQRAGGDRAAGQGPDGEPPASGARRRPDPPAEPISLGDWHVPPPGISPEGAPAARARRWPRPDAAAMWAAVRGSARTARRQPIEGAAIVLLGVGGFFLPFPFWPLGGLAAIMSRFFDVRDKWVAAGGPLGLALLGTVATAVAIGGSGDPALIYLHALRLDIGYLLRAGALLGGCYLAWRVRQGPRERLPPWKRY